MTNARHTLVCMEPVLTDETITCVIAMLITVAKTVQLNSQVVSQPPAKTTAFVFHIWKMKLTTNSTAHVKMASSERLVKLSAQ